MIRWHHWLHKRAFANTIETAVAFSQIDSLLTTRELSELKKEHGESALVWGVVPGDNGSNVTKWHKMQKGDIALFTGNNHIFGSATVTKKLYNTKLAEFLWGRDEKQQAWEYLYFLKDFQPKDIPYEHFSECVGYKKNFVPQGFNVLDQKRSDCYFDMYESGSSGKRSKKAATSLMVSFYQTNKESYPPSIRKKRDEIINLLMEGVEPEAAFAQVLTK